MSDPATIEIYTLSDPQTGAVRYIGKAVCSAARLKSHLRDARRRDTPVYRWIRKLAREGLAPVLAVVDRCAADEWKARETVAIAEGRAKGWRLLNVANGGDEPFCPPEVRAENGRRNAKLRTSTPEKARIYQLKRQIGQDLKLGYVTEATKAKLRIAAAKAPHLFGEWANI